MKNKNQIDEIVQHFIEMSSIRNHSRYSIQSRNPNEKITFYQYDSTFFGIGWEDEISKDYSLECNEFLINKIQSLINE